MQWGDLPPVEAQTLDGKPIPYTEEMQHQMALVICVLWEEGIKSGLTGIQQGICFVCKRRLALSPSTQSRIDEMPKTITLCGRCCEKYRTARKTSVVGKQLS